MASPRGVSAFLNEAARAKLERDRVLALLDELDAERGPVSAAARAKANRKLARALGRVAGEED
jgi:hypothetical protein